MAMRALKALNAFWSRMTALGPAETPPDSEEKIGASAEKTVVVAPVVDVAPDVPVPSQPAASPSALTQRDQSPHAASAGSTVALGEPTLQEAIIAAMKTIYDPEIPVDIYELGLIYEIKIDAYPHVIIEMTLTSPNCPEAQTLPAAVRYKIEAIPGVASAEVRVVWDPPWEPTFMSEGAKLALNML